MDDFGTLETGFNAEFGSEANTATTDYDALTNKPSINGVELSGDKSTEDLGIEIPAKVSELENDAGYQTESQQSAAISEAITDFYKSLCTVRKLEKTLKSRDVINAVSKESYVVFDNIKVADGVPCTKIRINPFLEVYATDNNNSPIEFTWGEFTATDNPLTDEWEFTGGTTKTQSLASVGWSPVGNSAMSNIRITSKPEISWDLAYNSNAESNPWGGLNNNEWTYSKSMGGYVFFRVDGISNDRTKILEWMGNNNYQISYAESVSANNVVVKFDKPFKNSNFVIAIERYNKNNQWESDRESTCTLIEYMVDAILSIRKVD